VLNTDWRPISQSELQARIDQGCARMSAAQLRLWNVIRMLPEKWQQHPYGDQGGGFWAVALIGRTVVWYNDLEEGFNRSGFSEYGVIGDYWCNSDELETTMQYLSESINVGQDLVTIIFQRRRENR
jgi:hypothetical protein